MRYALLFGWIVLCFGCGGDDSSTEEDAVIWNCICWTRPAGSTSTARVEEEIHWCSVEDPTDMLADRTETNAADIDRTGSCDPCEETEEPCHVDDNPE